MPKMMTVLTPEDEILLQLVDDNDKIVSTATFDRDQADNIADKIKALVARIPPKPKPLTQ